MVGLFLDLLYARSLRRVMRFISVVIQGWWKRVVVILLGTSCVIKLVRLVLMSHIVSMKLLMVNVWVNDVNECASCLMWSMFTCRQRCTFLHAGIARCACPDIVWHRDVRDGILVMKMSCICV